MRALLTFFFVLFFFSNQSFAHRCSGLCHLKKKPEASADHHKCCDQSESSQEDDQSHNCSEDHCLKFNEVETSLFLNPSTFDFQYDIFGLLTSQLFLITNSNDPIYDQKPIPQKRSNKVPLYIAYQKLFLP